MLMRLKKSKKNYIRLLSLLYDFNLFYVEDDNEMHFYDCFTDSIETIDDVIKLFLPLVKWNGGNKIKIIVGCYTIDIDHVDLIEVESIRKTLQLVGIKKLEDVYTSYMEGL